MMIMQRFRYAFIFAMSIVTTALVLSATSRGDEGKPLTLFNGKDLSGWTTFIPHKEKSIAADIDPKGVFKVEDGVIHVSGEEFGCLTTKDAYENYRLKLEV